MTAIVLVLVALAAALTLGLLAQEDPGYVLISRWPYEVEVSLALFLAGLVLVLTVLYILIRILFRVFRAPRDLHHWQARRRHDQADRATLIGYARLIEGEWERKKDSEPAEITSDGTPIRLTPGNTWVALAKTGTATWR